MAENEIEAIEKAFGGITEEEKVKVEAVLLEEPGQEQERFFKEFKEVGFARIKDGKKKSLKEMSEEEYEGVKDYIHTVNVVQAIKRGESIEESYKRLKVEKGKVVDIKEEGKDILAQEDIVEKIVSVASQLKTLTSEKFAGLSEEHSRMNDFIVRMVRTKVVNEAGAKILRAFWAQSDLKYLEKIDRVTFGELLRPEGIPKTALGAASQLDREVWLDENVVEKFPAESARVPIHEFAHVAYWGLKPKIRMKIQNAFRKFRDIAKNAEEKGGPNWRRVDDADTIALRDFLIEAYPDGTPSSAWDLFDNEHEFFGQLVETRLLAKKIPVKDLDNVLMGVGNAFRETLLGLQKASLFQDKASQKELDKILESVVLGQGGIKRQVEEKRSERGKSNSSHPERLFYERLRRRIFPQGCMNSPTCGGGDCLKRPNLIWMS